MLKYLESSMECIKSHKKIRNYFRYVVLLECLAIFHEDSSYVVIIQGHTDDKSLFFNFLFARATKGQGLLSIGKAGK